MAKIVRKTLREQVAQEIRMKILTGELCAGTKLVEQDLAEELGVSRAPVREALRQVEQEGLVEYTSHIGCSVKEFTLQDAYEIYLIRADLEILSVKMCDGHFSQKTIDKLQEITGRMASVDKLERFDEIIENDNEFHSCIVKESGLNRLYSLWDSLTSGNTIVFYRNVGREEQIIQKQSTIHQKIVDAIKTGDVDLICTTLMRHYMLTTERYLKQHNILPENFPYKINLDF